MNLSELPGGDLILTGLKDLEQGKADSIEALLVTIASIRLTEAGLEFPKAHLEAEPELSLYARLQNEREDAYPYYNALLDSLNSFCNALELRVTSKERLLDQINECQSM
jgi:hypothetical protein